MPHRTPPTVFEGQDGGRTLGEPPQSMTEPELIDIARDAILTLFKVSGPLLLVGLVVGLAIAIFQTLTQIQEMTLTFVPKIMAVFAVLVLLIPYFLNTLNEFWVQMLDRVTQAGGVG